MTPHTQPQTVSQQPHDATPCAGAVTLHARAGQVTAHMTPVTRHPQHCCGRHRGNANAAPQHCSGDRRTSAASSTGASGDGAFSGAGVNSWYRQLAALHCCAIVPRLSSCSTRCASSSPSLTEKRSISSDDCTYKRPAQRAPASPRPNAAHSHTVTRHPRQPDTSTTHTYTAWM